MAGNKDIGVQNVWDKLQAISTLQFGRTGGDIDITHNLCCHHHTSATKDPNARHPE